MSNAIEEVTTIANRHIRPGREDDFEDWMERVTKVIRTYPGYRGLTVIEPGNDPNARYVIYRFADKASMANWEKSEERRKLLEEVEQYASQRFEAATGLETWFALPNVHAMVAPPRWKMMLVTLFAALIVSAITHLVLAPYLNPWPLLLDVLIYTTLLVLVLTYFAMPNLTKLLRRWLYPP